MPTIQVKDAGGTTIYLNVASGAGTSGDPYVLQDSIPTGTNSIGTIGLDTGTNSIGKLAANSGVDIGDVDILSIAAGDNNIGNVDIASALPAGTNAIGKLAANSGVDIGDVDVTSLPSLAAGSASIGTLGANSGVDIGDVDVTSLPALAAGTAAIGATKDNGPETAGTFTYTTSADMTTAASIGPAPTGSQKSVLLQAVISTDTAMQFTIQMETTAGAERQSWYLPANGSVIFVPRHPVKLGTADKRWQGLASVAGNVAISTVTTSEA